MMTMMHKENKGSSMITVLVVVTVLMAIVLSVLQISYRYFVTENGDVYRQKAREAAQSLSVEIKEELTKCTDTVNNFDQQQDQTTELWKFIRYNLGRGDWKYYETEEVTRNNFIGDSDKFSYYDVDSFKSTVTEGTEKVFTLQAKTAEPPADLSMVKEELPELTVTLTWKPGKYSNNLSGTRLYVKTECKMGDYTYNVTDTFRLETGEYPIEAGDELNKTVTVEEGVDIYKYHRWKWVYESKH